MPPKVDPRDWDRLFKPGAPRRGGPLRALVNILLIGAVVVLLGGGTFIALRFGLDQVRASTAATARAAETTSVAAIATRTARALASSAAETAPATTPTVATLTVIGQGSVVAGGNLRSQPVVSPETVIGQICPGDRIDFLDQNTGADGSVWYRIRVTEVAENCTPQRVTLGSLGWASSTLLSPPAP